MTRQRQQDQTKPRRRWIVIGPGIVLAIILALQVVISNYKTTAAPPIVERQVLGAKVADGAVAAPEVGYVLKHRERLALTAKQTAALGDLQSEWKTRSQPLVADMDKSAADFGKFMREAGEKATMRDIQAHAGPLSEMSRQVSSLRRVYWEKALQVLDEQQRSEIQRQVSQESAKRISVVSKQGVPR